MADSIPIMAYVTMPFVFTRVLENWDALFDLYDGEVDAYMRANTEDLNVTYVWSTRKGNLTLTPATAAATMTFLELPVAGDSIVIGEFSCHVRQRNARCQRGSDKHVLIRDRRRSGNDAQRLCRPGHLQVRLRSVRQYADRVLRHSRLHGELPSHRGQQPRDRAVLSDDTLRGGGALLTMTTTVYDAQYFIPLGETEATYVYDVMFQNDVGPQAILFRGSILWKQGVTR